MITACTPPMAGLAQWSTDPNVNNAICTAANDQFAPTIVSDGAGGAIITWEDYRSGTTTDIYAQQISANGQLGVVTEVQNDVAALPESFRLEQNYPNPFNPVTVICYQLPVDSRVRLKVYDMLGRDVTTLVDEVQSPGYRSVKFKASQLPSGMYMYRLVAGTFVDVKKLLLLK